MVILDDGAYRQVSVGKLGVCGIRADTDALRCIGSRTKRDPAHEVLKGDSEWDQVRVGNTNICAVSMDSVLHCTGGLGMHIPAHVEVY
jgi:hypothetical protein